VAVNFRSKLDSGAHQSGLGCRDGDAKPRSDIRHRKAFYITEQHDIAHDDRKVLNLPVYQLRHFTPYKFVFRIFRSGRQRDGVQAGAKAVKVDKLAAGVCSERHAALVNHNA
jgi:hypothetical protein